MEAVKTEFDLVKIFRDAARKKEEATKMFYILKECTEDHTSYEIPLVVDIQFGEVWGFGEEVTEANINNF